MHSTKLRLHLQIRLAHWNACPSCCAIRASCLGTDNYVELAYCIMVRHKPSHGRHLNYIVLIRKTLR